MKTTSEFVMAAGTIWALWSKSLVCTCWNLWLKVPLKILTYFNGSFRQTSFIRLDFDPKAPWLFSLQIYCNWRIIWSDLKWDLINSANIESKNYCCSESKFHGVGISFLHVRYYTKHIEYINSKWESRLSVTEQWQKCFIWLSGPIT